MKKLLIAMLVLTFILVTAAAALAGPGRNGGNYRTDSGLGSDLHNGTYTTATNKCSFCHAVHNADATNSYKLLRTDGAGGVLAACNFCHIAGSNSAPLPYAALINPIEAEHRVSGLATVVPDRTAGKTDAELIGAALDCKDCHNAAPHNAGGFGKMFKEDYITAGTLNPVCSRCHGKNNVGATFDQVSHPMVDNTEYRLPAERTGDVVNPVGGPSTQNCQDCHANGGAEAASLFPHRSDASRFLNVSAGSLTEDGTGGTLDAICIACHQWNAGADGVGETF